MRQQYPYVGKQQWNPSQRSGREAWNTETKRRPSGRMGRVVGRRAPRVQPCYPATRWDGLPKLGQNDSTENRWKHQKINELT